MHKAITDWYFWPTDNYYMNLRRFLTRISPVLCTHKVKNAHQITLSFLRTAVGHSHKTPDTTLLIQQSRWLFCHTQAAIIESQKGTLEIISFQHPATGRNNHNENYRGLGTPTLTPYQSWLQHWPKYPSKQQAFVLYTWHVPRQGICMGKKTFHTPAEINTRGFSLLQRSCWTWSWRRQKTQSNLWGWFVWRDQEETSRRRILPTAGGCWRGSAHTGKPRRTWTPFLHVQTRLSTGNMDIRGRAEKAT